jgi:putative transposase
VRDLIERLYAEGVDTVYVGDLTDVLVDYWSAEVNEKTHQFWAYRSFIDRLATTAEEYGITVEVRSEAYTTAECPVCGEREKTERDGDVFRCSCGYEGHADLGASRTFLERQAGVNLDVGSMARPVRQVGRPYLVGVITLSREGQSQRGAHKPEYPHGETYLRGCGIANILTGGIPFP